MDLQRLKTIEQLAQDLSYIYCWMPAAALTQELKMKVADQIAQDYSLAARWQVEDSVR
jgi:hypothetical protein